MPRGSEDASKPSETQLTTRRRGAGELDPPPELRAALRPWVDVDEVGISGLWTWLHTIIPLLPPPGSPESSPARPEGKKPEADDRVRQLATALTDCARERARLNFRAYEYYSDNTILARRVHALEGMLRNNVGEPDTSPPDAETERATERYLPGRRGGASP
jgi:hypothetical protein